MYVLLRCKTFAKFQVKRMVFKWYIRVTCPVLVRGTYVRAGAMKIVKVPWYYTQL